MQALAFRLVRISNNEVLMEGIVRDGYDNIYPTEYDSSLGEEFPDIPYEVELNHFNIKGIRVETHSFELSWNQMLKFKI